MYPDLGRPVVYNFHRDSGTSNRSFKSILPEKQENDLNNLNFNERIPLGDWKSGQVLSLVDGIY